MYAAKGPTKSETCLLLSCCILLELGVSVSIDCSNLLKTTPLFAHTYPQVRTRLSILQTGMITYKFY